VSWARFAKVWGEAGYFEGKNVTIEYRWAEGHYDRLPALQSKIMDGKVFGGTVHSHSGADIWGGWDGV